MGKYNLLGAPNLYLNWNDQHFRLNKIKEIEDYFIAEIKWELMSKKLSKYIASFDYFNKFFIVLSASGSVSIASFATVIGAPVEMASARFSLAFLMSTEIITKLLKITRNKNKKHNKIIMLARSKLDSAGSKKTEHW